MGIWGDFQSLTETTGGGRGVKKTRKLRRRRLWMVPYVNDNLYYLTTLLGKKILDVTRVI